MTTGEMAERMATRIRLSDDVNPSEDLIYDCIESAKALYLSLRFPYTPDDKLPDEVERRYQDWQYRAAMEIYSKIGAEGQITHSENGISRTFDSGSLSKGLLAEIVPVCGVIQ